MKVVAVMIVRNEEACLPRTLARLSEQGFKVAVLDNESTDRTRDILESYAPHTVSHIEQAPFHGVFEWRSLLNRLESMMQGIDADWFHLNSPDEMMDPMQPGENLIEALARVEEAGYNAINYEEFLFCPVFPDLRAEGKNFDELMRYYYYFAAKPMRQVRTWKTLPGLSRIASGGHALEGEGVKLLPENWFLRHYIALSQEHFKSQYLHRVFPKDELERGWHRKREEIKQTTIQFPKPWELQEWDGKTPLRRHERWDNHFWEWTPRSRLASLLGPVRWKIGGLRTPRRGFHPGKD